MKLILIALSSVLLVSRVASLQFLLSSKEPFCISVTPKSPSAKFTVTYFVSGLNEDQVKFVASQNNRELISQSGFRDKVVELNNRGSADVKLCWEKLDNKTKKVTFLIGTTDGDLDAKATIQTVDNLVTQIDSLTQKLDQISMNIVIQKEAEAEHF
jgi:hypothetical protein